jgi:hypothetical protein
MQFALAAFARASHWRHRKLEKYRIARWQSAKRNAPE